MKSIMISIQPKWCELIASGKKTVEVRKTKPKLDVPFKCYIYCTKGDSLNYLRNSFFDNVNKFWVDNKAFGANVARANGKVIGEFVCDTIHEFTKAFFDEQEPQDTEEITFWLDQFNLSYHELRKYVGTKDFYGWHISDLVIYDKPKELSEFIVPSKIGCCNEGKCRGCKYLDRGNGFNVEDDCNAKFCTDEYKPLRKAPQSWCYVEELR